jgi:hypothetical protein
MKPFNGAILWCMGALVLGLNLNPIEAGAGIVTNQKTSLTTITIVDSETGQETKITGYFTSPKMFIRTPQQNSSQKETSLIGESPKSTPTAREPMTQ